MHIKLIISDYLCIPLLCHSISFSLSFFSLCFSLQFNYFLAVHNIIILTNLQVFFADSLICVICILRKRSISGTRSRLDARSVTAVSLALARDLWAARYHPERKWPITHFPLLLFVPARFPSAKFSFSQPIYHLSRAAPIDSFPILRIGIFATNISKNGTGLSYAGYIPYSR